MLFPLADPEGAMERCEHRAERAGEVDTREVSAGCAVQTFLSPQTVCTDPFLVVVVPNARSCVIDADLSPCLRYYDVSTLLNGVFLKFDQRSSLHALKFCSCQRSSVNMVDAKFCGPC